MDSNFILQFNDETDEEVIQMKQAISQQMNVECLNTKTIAWSPFDEDNLSLGHGMYYNGGLGKYYCFEKRKYDTESKEVLELRRLCAKCEQTRLKYLTWRFFRIFHHEHVPKV